MSGLRFLALAACLLAACTDPRADAPRRDLSELVAAGAPDEGTGPRSPILDADSVRSFVRAFYDWYVDADEDWPVVLSERREVLHASTAADLEAGASRLAIDPFLGMRDRCEAYVVGEIEFDDYYRAAIHGVCNGRRSDAPDVVALVLAGSPEFYDFEYPHLGTSLLGQVDPVLPVVAPEQTIHVGSTAGWEPSPVPISTGYDRDRPPGFASTEIRFANGNALTVPVHAAGANMVLDVGMPAPWLILSGYPCTECDAGLEIFAVRADAGAPAEVAAYPYPGTYYEMGAMPDEPPFRRARVFIGACLPGIAPGLVVLLEDRQGDDGWLRSARIVELGDVTGESQADWDDALEQAVTGEAGKGRCVEIPGQEQ